MDISAGTICRSVVIPVHVPDIKRGLEWYAELLRAQPERGSAENVYAFQLVKNCWLEVSERRTRGKVKVRIEVDDVGHWRDHHRTLEGRVGPLRSADGLLYYTVSDPHGNAISPFQPASSRGAEIGGHAPA